MAKVTDRTDLADGSEFDVNLTTKKVTVNIAGAITAGSANGVTTQALYGALQDLWKSGTNHNKYRFPFFMIDGPIASMLELRGGWEFTNAASIELLRDGGFAYTTDFEGTTKTAEYACFVQDGTFEEASAQPYWAYTDGGAPTDFFDTDEINACIQLYGDATHGNFDSRAQFHIFYRKIGYMYGHSDFSEDDTGNLTYRSYSFAMSSVADLNAVASDATVDGSAPYTGMTITTLDGSGFTAWANATVYGANAVVSSVGRWYITVAGGTSNGTGVADDVGVTWVSYTGERDVEGTYYAYKYIIAGNSGTKVQIRDWLQRQLRKTTDIDQAAGTQRGDTDDHYTLEFEGDLLVTSEGLYVDAVVASERSDYRFTDIGGVRRNFVFVLTVSVTGLVNAAAAYNRLQIKNVTAASASAWVANTVYATGAIVKRTTGLGTENTAGLFFRATTGGTSHATTEPTWVITTPGVFGTPGSTTTDNTITWECFAILLYDADPAATSYSATYLDGEEFLTGESYEIKFAEMDAGTTFKTYHTTGVASSTGFTIAATMTADAVFAENALNGSSYESTFSPNFTSNYVVLDSNTDFSGKSAYAYFCYTLTTSNGMYRFWDGVTALDSGNYRIETDVLNLYFDETAGFVKQTDAVRIFRADGTRPALDPTTGGNGIEIQWRVPVNVVSVAGSSVITGDIADLNDLSITDVQTALTNQGLTTTRAANLDKALTTGKFIALK